MIAETKDDVLIDAVNITSPEVHRAIDRKAKKYGLPHLQDFIGSVTRIDPNNDAFGRRYQFDTLARNGLKIISPISGEIIISRRSVAVRGRIFYHFREAVEYYVVSSRIRLGYPLAAIFVPEANVLLRWEPGGRRGIQNTHLRTLIELVGKEPISLPSPAAIPVIVLGHRNFAHHLWNELSAIQSLVTRPLHSMPFEMMVTREPLGAIDKIFPELAGRTITRLGAAAELSGNDPAKLFVNLGGYRISSGLRTRIASHAAASATADTNLLIKQLREHCSPVFWLSLRTQRPTFVNQADVLQSLAVELLDSFPSCGILLDGFSLPADWGATGSRNAGKYMAAAAATREDIEVAIQGILRERGGSPQRMIVNIGGIGILDSIALAQLADAYFCHVGTVQHKIAWTTNRPGIIHGGRDMLAGNPAEWHASRLEDGYTPVQINAELVEDLDPESREPNYRAVDCPRLAEFVRDHFAHFLALRRETGSEQ